MDIDELKIIMDKYPRCYVGQYKNYFDLLIDGFDKKELEDYLSRFVDHFNANAILAYYDEYSLDEIFEYLDLDLMKENRQKIVILDRNTDKEVFNSVINKYKDVDLNKDNLIEDYLIDIFPYIPFTHMAILIDDEYLRLVNYKGSLQLDEIRDVEFKTWLKLDGVIYLGKQIHIVYANENVDVAVTARLLYKLNKVNAFINNLAIIEMDRIKIKEADNRFNSLEELHNSMSYEVDDDYKIIHVSRRLNERFNNDLVGNYCYEMLYDREEPCKDCPLRKEHTNSYLISSNLYNREINIEDKKATIYLLNKKNDYVNNREDLNNVLLGLLNNPNAKGYLVVSKIDSLPRLANKYKLKSEDIVKVILGRLKTYGLTDNLYRKEEDEFVYVLTHASKADAVKIAKDISKAFLETFEINNIDFDFLPKVIMLSYPLEVNTLFSLDSLSRSLFNIANKKGMLYRLDEEPTPIDDHRHYMDIVEEAFKNNLIPVSYHRIKDIQNKDRLSFVGYRFLDENHNHIPDDQISLYVKIDKKYETFMDKFVRSFNYEDENQTFVTSIGKEGLQKRLFDTLIGFFNSKHIPLNRVIFEAKEKDIYNNLDAVNYALDLGLSIALDINDSGSYPLDITRFRYIRINGNRLESDRGYQNKISTTLTKGLEILIDEKHKDLITNVRYTF